MLTTSVHAKGRKDANVGHIFGAAGLLYNFPSSVRIGRRSWEFGLLNRSTVGINKLVNINNSAYATFGFSFSGTQTAFGVFGGMGLEFYQYGPFQVRTELSGSVNTNNDHQAEILIGVNVNL